MAELVADHPNLVERVFLCSSLPPLVHLFLPFPGDLPSSQSRGCEFPEGVFPLWLWDQAVQTTVPKACQSKGRSRHRGTGC